LIPSFDSSCYLSIVSSRTLPKDIASDQSNDGKEFLEYEDSESQRQFSVCSSVLGRMVDFGFI